MDNGEFDAELKRILPETSVYLKDTGCLKCDILPGIEIKQKIKEKGNVQM